MLTETQNLDTPWRRLRWTLPMSLLIWALALWSLAYFMGKPSHRQAEQAPIDAQFIELPSPEPIVKPAPPKALATPKQQTAKPAVKPETPLTKATAIETPTAPAEPVPDAPQAIDTPHLTQKIPEIPAPTHAPSAPAPAAAGLGATNTVMNSGAHAITRPMPEIPDDLREETLNAVALARFHVDVDGKAAVELAKPTRNPRLNRILLDALKNWKFSPAIKDGKPVASTEDIVIKVNVD